MVICSRNTTAPDGSEGSWLIEARTSRSRVVQKLDASGLSE